ncbi:MAG: endonuclease III [Chloroflexi bacterium]|nr:endonuclease III [Chloroflexota bacterium]
MEIPLRGDRQPARVADVLELLERHHGPFVWRSRADPVSELIQTVLSQNTSDVNSGRAFACLKATFPTWEAVANADTQKLAAAIQTGGLGRIKAPRIQAILRSLEEQRGSFDLSFLRETPLAEAKKWLRSLPGVGPKTAACVLLFSLGLPALPVDTHVYRVARRLGLIPQKASPDAAHDILESIVPAKDIYRFHMGLIAHGRQVC